MVQNTNCDGIFVERFQKYLVSYVLNIYMNALEDDGEGAVLTSKQAGASDI